MLKTGKYILILILCFSLFAGCKTSEIPAYYRFSPSQIQKGITGSWTKLTLKSKSDLEVPSELSGELIAVQPDSIYILTEEKLEAVSSKTIDEAVLQIYTNQGKKIGTITALVVLPNIIAAMGNSYYSQAIIGLGMPMIITGITSAIVEIFNDSNLLVFPARNPLNDFKKYARFPKGLPKDIDRKRLQLIK